MPFVKNLRFSASLEESVLFSFVLFFFLMSRFSFLRAALRAGLGPELMDATNASVRRIQQVLAIVQRSVYQYEVTFAFSFFYRAWLTVRLVRFCLTTYFLLLPSTLAFFRSLSLSVSVCLLGLSEQVPDG